MEGNLPQQQCHPASTAVEKDDLIIPVSISVDSLSTGLSTPRACVFLPCLVSPGFSVDHRLRALS